MTRLAPAAHGDLAGLIRAAGYGWALDRLGSPDRANAWLLRHLAAADACALQRFPDRSVRLTVDALVGLYDRSPHGFRAFMERLFFAGSPQMLVMGWRVLSGAEVRRVSLAFETLQTFRLEVSLRLDRHVGDEVYESDDVEDVAFLRHFATAVRNGHMPQLLGFFPTWPEPQTGR